MDLNDESPFLATLRAVKGNVPQHVKDNVIELYRGATQGQRFLMSITRRLKAIESNIYSRPEEPSKKEVKMVFEIDVTEGELRIIQLDAPESQPAWSDMCHFGNSVHGGCVASLVDL
ncbi:hypothetical protein NM688_g7174 [Phlebia brevispora]|uniref:Uncharacterized protein n=1 Tax=Phlebia brevispora TaxID=194682 RepID=A0ACC1S8C6_9APHY|nr:hypothetical protein NM688_g7174 [Phlebia brevispora]